MSGLLWTRRQVIAGGAAGVAGLLLPAKGLGAGMQEALAKTSAGRIRGRVEDGVFVFQGVPYGMDTAKTRFMAPKPPEPWTAVRDCLAWGPRTIQPYSPPAPPRSARPAAPPQTAPQPPRERGYYMPPDEGEQSEDCLNLNVWTRGLRDGKKRPVMVYFHGGGYTYGTVNSVLYNGKRLAELGGESFADSGMAGQLDLVLALRWIRENIAEFGGDASRVLVFGQSGGGGKCSTLMAMPPAKGLFHRVVCMSGQLIAG